MLNRDFTNQWIEHLRSDKYAQGKGWLHSSSGQYCCLGVACTLLAADDYLSEDALGWFTDELGNTDRGSDKVLPPNAVRVMGINEIGEVTTDFAEWLSGAGVGVMEEYDLASGFCLTGLNDAGVSFAGIAYLLEMALEYEAATGQNAFLSERDPWPAEAQQTASKGTPDAVTV